jgi:hypothetical protein
MQARVVLLELSCDRCMLLNLVASPPQDGELRRISWLLDLKNALGRGGKVLFGRKR